MASYTLKHLGHPVLRMVASPFAAAEVTGPARALVQEMRRIMEESHGIGLAAAPQIGVSKQLFIASAPDARCNKELPETVFFNPKLSFPHEDKMVMQEGCLSLPGLVGLVPRYKEVEVSFLDEEGAEKRLRASGFVAGVLQHENDHLLGKVYLDHVQDLSTDIAYVSEAEHLPQFNSWEAPEGDWEYL